MSEKIDQFTDDLHVRLTEVDDRIKSFRASVDSAKAKGKADLQAKRDKARADFESRKREAEQAQARVKTMIEEKRAETAADVEAWKQGREVNKLERRAQRAEDYAATQAWFALVAVEDAEYAMLDAVVTRIEADEAATG